MSDTAILLSLGLLGAVMLAMLAFIIIGNRRNKQRQRDGAESYNWQPAQDFEVKFDQEMPMTPPFPHLRGKDGKEPPDEDLRRW